MTIQRSDIKLMQSQRMENTTDGGGKVTGNVILDGQHNSIFEDISDLNRAYGKVDIMKTFLTVSSPDTDKYFGSNVAVITPPEDESVSVTIMSTRDHYDYREDARDFIESYLARGAELNALIYGTQLEGQRVVRITQKTNIDLPTVGQVLVLTDKGNTQYVRVTEVAFSRQEFYYPNYSKVLVRHVVDIKISEPLRYEFSGYSPSPYTSTGNASMISSTVVANAAKYYGVRECTKDALLGDMKITADGIYSQLVPSARTEIGVVDLNAAGKRTAFTAAGEPMSYSSTINIAANVDMYVGNSVLPGSLTITIGSANVTDKGGFLMLGEDVVGDITYDTGLLEFNGDVPNYGTATKSFAFTPASPVQNASESALVNITAINRGYTYVGTLNPIPKPGSVTISYMVAGDWYTMADNGDGALKGSTSAVGSASLDFETGSIIITLGALPDVDTAILIQWGVNIDSTDAVGDVGKPYFELSVPNVKRISEGEMTFTIGETVIEDTDSRMDVDYTNGKVKYSPTSLPAKGESILVNWVENAIRRSQDANFTDSGASMVTVLLNGNIRPNSVSFRMRFTPTGYDADATEPNYPSKYVFYNVKDDGSGNLVLWVGSEVHSTVGTVNYTNGNVIINTFITAPCLRQHWKSKGWFFTSRRVMYKRGYEDSPLKCDPIATYSGNTYDIFYSNVTTSDTGEVTLAPTEMKIDVQLAELEVIVKESLNFSLVGETYVEQNGVVVRNVSKSTSVGEDSGIIDRVNGLITLTDWKTGTANFSMKSLGSTFDVTFLTDYIAFKTPDAPLAPGSLYIQCTDLYGFSHAITVDGEGIINEGIFNGYANHRTGVIELELDRPVDMDSLRFNCVIYNTLPLDAELIGLDPVRLPSDGRVPIFEKGDLILIHQTAKTLQAGLPSNRTIDSGLNRLAELYLEDLIGNRLSEEHYTIDLDAGTLTTLGTFPAQSCNLVSRFEDMILATDVDISGEISLGRQLSHNYDAGKARVSSILIADDLWSRYYNLFDQQSWTSKFSDSLIGNATTSEYNDVFTPLLVSNEGSITERWAIVFTSSSSFKLIGEHVGQIATGSINSTFEPNNPNTNVPYFTIYPAGWGTGWSTGNVLRFNTQGAIFPFWNIRTILQGETTITEDYFELQLRGNINQD